MSGRRFALLLGLAVLVGGGVRLAVMDATFPVATIGDERYYLTVAASIALGHGHQMGEDHRALRPPAASYLLSWFVDPGDPLQGPHAASLLRRLLLVQVALGAGVVLLTGLLGRALFDGKTGILAAALVALEPTSVAFGHYIWSENLFALLLTGALALVVWARERPGWTPPILAGLVFGFAGLTRELGLAIAGTCAFWLWWTAEQTGRRQALARGAVLLAVAGAVVVPWTIRNYVVLDHFVPVSTIGWFTIANGNALEEDRWLSPGGPKRKDFKVRYRAIGDEVERYEWSQGEAWRNIAAEQPLWLPKKIVRNGSLLFSPDSWIFYKIRKGAYGDVAPERVKLLIVATVAVYGFLVVAGILGVAIAAGRGRRSLPCLAFGALAFLHVVAIANSRHRAPLVPLLAVYASFALVAWRTLPSLRQGRRWVAPAAVLAFFFCVCIPYFATFSHASSLWWNPHLPVIDAD